MKSGIFHNPYMKPERSTREVFEWTVRFAEEADKAGVNDFMIGEHATEGWQPIPNPEVVIGACALVTEQIRFAPMAHIVPLHDPSSLAIQVGWLSQVLEGRYFLGIAIGAYPRDAIVRGQPADFSEARPRMKEALEIMEKVWAREPFEYRGEYSNAGYPAYEPGGIAPKGKPNEDLNILSDFTPWGGADQLEIAVTGLSPDSASLKYAGAAGFMPISFFGGLDALASHWRVYSEAAEKAGRTPDRNRYRVTRDIMIADTDAEAKRRAIEGGIGYFWERYLIPIYLRYGLLEGYIADSGTGISVDEVTLEWLAEHVWLCGSPETVKGKIERMFEVTGGFGTIVMNSHDSIDDPAPWFESTRRLAQEVAPSIDLAVTA